MYYGGVEGGATHSKLIVCNALGHPIATVHGPSTNHWLLGIAECAQRIARMTADAKRQAGLAADQPLRTLCLSLSGCEQPATNQALRQALHDDHPHCAQHIVVCSDTVGTVFTASRLGGLCLIAGTGSNAMLANPDGAQRTCGGWGNMLADEGSAWWIAHRAIKTYFDHVDGLQRSAHDVRAVWRCIREHFGVAERSDVLEHCYARFRKCEFAKLCVRLAAAADAGDALCAQLFADAGRYLARLTLALAPHADRRLLTAGGELDVVCAGSVWNSWHLLRAGFEREWRAWLSARSAAGEQQLVAFSALRLVRLTQLMALGAVYIGADAIGCDLPRDYAANYEVFDVFEVANATAAPLKTMNGVRNGEEPIQLNGS